MTNFELKEGKQPVRFFFSLFHALVFNLPFHTLVYIFPSGKIFRSNWHPGETFFLHSYIPRIWSVQSFGYDLVCTIYKLQN